MTVTHAGPKNVRHFCVERASRKKTVVQWLAGVPHHPWLNLVGPTESIRHSRVFDAAFDESHFHDWARNETSYYALFCARWLGIMCYEPSLTEDKNRVQTGG